MLRTLSCLNSMEVNSMEIEPSMPWARPCWIFFTGDCFQRILFGSELLLRVWDGVDRLIRLYVSQRLNSTKDLLTKQRHYSFLSLITAIFAVVWNLARRSGSCFAVSSAIYHVIQIKNNNERKCTKHLIYPNKHVLSQNKIFYKILIRVLIFNRSNMHLSDKNGQQCSSWSINRPSRIIWRMKQILQIVIIV